MDDVDANVVAEVQSGNTEAFARLVERHRDRVFVILLRLSGDADVANELAQETFVRAYRGLASFRGDARFGTWVVQIALHLARDRIRRRQRHTVISLDELRERQEDASPFVETRAAFDPLEDVSARETQERFERALNDLPPSYREVFVLRHLENVSYDEVSHMTGDSVGSLKVRAHRARKLLKEALFPDDGELATRRRRSKGR